MKVQFTLQRYNYCTTVLLHPFNGLFPRTTWINWYQKGKINLQQNAASLLLWARQVGDIDRLLQQCRVVTGSAMFSVYVDS